MNFNLSINLNENDNEVSYFSYKGKQLNLQNFLETEINKEEPFIFNNPKCFNNIDLQNIPNFNAKGRKRKNSGIKGKHNEYAQDNMIRKFKNRIEKGLLGIINPKIKSKNLNVNIRGKQYKIKEILKINNKEKIDTSVSVNKGLLNKQIKEFFYTDIGGNYSGHPKDYNKFIIHVLYNSDNCEDVTCILDMTFLECLKYYRGDVDSRINPKYLCLSGLEKFYGQLKNEFSHEPKYLKDFLYLINNFEKIYYEKKERNITKKNKKLMYKDEL